MQTFSSSPYRHPGLGIQPCLCIPIRSGFGWEGSSSGRKGEINSYSLCILYRSDSDWEGSSSASEGEMNTSRKQLRPKEKKQSSNGDDQKNEEKKDEVKGKARSASKNVLTLMEFSNMSIV